MGFYDTLKQQIVKIVNSDKGIDCYIIKNKLYDDSVDEYGDRAFNEYSETLVRGIILEEKKSYNYADFGANPSTRTEVYLAGSHNITKDDFIKIINKTTTKPIYFKIEEVNELPKGDPVYCTYFVKQATFTGLIK